MAEQIPIPDLDVTSYVLENVDSHADKPALIDGPSGRSIDYGAFRDAVRAFAGNAAARGLGKGDAFALYMPNLPEYAVAFHGIASAGGRVTTVNPLYTPGELSHQLRDAGARFLLTVPPMAEAALKAAKDSPVEEVFVLGEHDGATPASELLAPAEAPQPSIDPEADLAVLPYSSGTTGLPKGVMLSHRNLVANLIQVGREMALGPEHTMIGVLPFFHIYGMTVIMNLGLRSGATIVTMPRFDLEQFLGLIEHHRVTHGFIVPPIALALAKHPAVEGADLSSLELLLSGAAPLGPELTEAVQERVDCLVAQGYGLTETSPVTHTMPIDRERNRPGTIGPPLAGTECRVVDPESGEDAPQGERGELWIRGPQVMRGYLNNEEATRATIDEDGWLHTGDVAVVDEAGYYKIVDRLKELIKYKGFQVAPAELEALIIGHPDVADCAVVGVPDEECGELPKAYVVPAGEGFDPEELIAWVATRVAPQKKIRLVETIEQIPKSASGKILRRELAGKA